jgi:hypothetical protein
LIRAVIVTALLCAAAGVAWSRPTGCAPAEPLESAPGNGAASSALAGASAPPRSGSEGDVETGGDAGRGNGARAAVPAGTVGVPVRLAEPSALRLLRSGDRVDLVGVDPDGGPADRVLADDVLVLGITGADDPTAGGLLLALDPAEAQRAVGAHERLKLSVFLR